MRLASIDLIDVSRYLIDAREFSTVLEILEIFWDMLWERLFMSLLTLLILSPRLLTAEIIYTVDNIEIAIAIITPTPRILEVLTIWTYHPYIE
jgi:hypothetical protein